MATGTAAAPEIQFLGDSIERDMHNLPVTFQGGTEAGGQRICHVLLAKYEPSTSSRGWRLKVCIYAAGITQNEVLQLAGLLVRWEGVGLNPEQVGVWNMGSMGPDSWVAVYSLDVLAEQIYPSAFDPPIVDPAMELITDFEINGVPV